MILPRFTPVGFNVMQMPTDLWAALRRNYQANVNTEVSTLQLVHSSVAKSAAAEVVHSSMAASRVLAMN